MDGAHIYHVKEVLKAEFERIGMSIDVMNINVANKPAHLRGSDQPIGYLKAKGITNMQVEFHCNQTQYKYLTPFIESAYRNDITICPDVSWSTRHNALDPLKTETRYKCSMTLHLTGGSMQTFIESFREATDKLFIAIESKAFDEEVVKTLSEE